MMQATVKHNVGNPRGGGGEGLLYEKDWSSSWIQIKDSGLTWGVDDETSPFLVVKVEKMENKFKLKKPKLKKVNPLVEVYT